MVEDKECQKRFNKIIKRKENEGYVEWRKWVVGQIEDYDAEKLQNLVKRTEINMKMAEEDCYLKVPGIMVNVISLAAVLITAIVTMLLTTMGDVFDVYNNQIDKSMLNKYAELVSETMMELSGQNLSGCGTFIIIYMILLSVENLISEKNILRRARTKIYYAELLDILKDEMVSKQQEKMND